MKNNHRCKSLISRLATYSIMAGAALAFTPVAGAVVITSNLAKMAPRPSVNELVIQHQQVQSQRIRHLRQKARYKKKIHVMMTSKTTGSYSSSGYSTTSSSYNYISE